MAFGCSRDFLPVKNTKGINTLDFYDLVMKYVCLF